METKLKICSQCLCEKPVSEFFINNAKKDGLTAKCKICLREYRKKRELTVDRKEYKKSYKKRPEVIQKRNERKRELRKNPEYRKLESIKSNERQKQIRKDPEKKLEFNKKQNKLKNEWYNKRYHNDPLFRMWEIFSSNFSSRIEKNNQTSLQLIGYSKNELFNCLGSRPDNHHLDHKIPVTWFKEYVPKIVYDLRNLHWINEKINLSKNNRYSHNVSKDFFEIAKPYLKDEFVERFVEDETYVFDKLNPISF